MEINHILELIEHEEKCIKIVENRKARYKRPHLIKMCDEWIEQSEQEIERLRGML